MGIGSPSAQHMAGGFACWHKRLQTNMFQLHNEEDRMRARDTTDPVERVGGKSQRDVQTPDSDVTEGFRRARTAIEGVTKDLVDLRRRARTLVKGSGRPAK
jgi:hypothetical protein